MRIRWRHPLGRYRRDSSGDSVAVMAPTAAQKLAELLESAPPEDRRSITAWLLERPSNASSALDLLTRSGMAPAGALRRLGGTIFMDPADRAADPAGSVGEWLSGPRPDRLRGLLPPGQESQLVTLRLPAERHTQLRQWCTEHDFSMAAVIRGLVEQFLEAQGVPDTAPAAAPDAD
jgi:hypothetical protein